MAEAKGTGYVPLPLADHRDRDDERSVAVDHRTETFNHPHR